MVSASALAAGILAPGTFQQTINASSASSCAAGDTARKNDPGFTTAKYSRAVVRDEGMFAPQFRASTHDVYMFAPSTPPITITAKPRTICRAMPFLLCGGIYASGVFGDWMGRTSENRMPGTAPASAR